MNILPNWSSFDEVLCQIEGRDFETGRVLNTTKYRSANQDSVDTRAREASRLAMRKLYDKRRKMGLTAHGKPFKRPANAL